MKILTYALFEKFVLGTDTEESIGRLDSIEDPDRVEHGLNVLFHWFRGTMMGRKNSPGLDDAFDTLKILSKVYHKKPQKGAVYRAVHLHTEPGMTEDEIKNIKNCQSGPKNLQSWATTQKGAEWFFTHFARDQNQRGDPEENKAWVILKTDASNLEQLLTFRECLQFLQDVHINNTEVGINKMIDNLNRNEMLRQHELICYTPDAIPVEVVDILVPPAQLKMAA